MCGLPAGAEPELPHLARADKVTDRDKIIRDFDRLTVRQKRMLFWEISGIILLSGIVVSLIINFIVIRNITWARYNVTASLVLFANISVLTFWRNRPFLLFAGSLAANSAFLFLLDIMSSNIGWGEEIGIPILVSLYLLLGGVVWLIGISRYLGFNILAVLFSALGLFLICIEAIVSHYFLNAIHLSWSVIAAVSMIVISALMLYVHYKLKMGIELKRFFHI